MLFYSSLPLQRPMPRFPSLMQARFPSIQKDLKVAWHTIAAIRTREASVIEATRKHIRGLIGVAAQLAVERLIEKLQDDKIPPSVLPIASGIMIDKMRQSEGEPSQTIEVKKSITLEDVRKELAEMKRSAIDAETADEES